jgi:aminodeoxyfutalosine deaminase
MRGMVLDTQGGIVTRPHLCDTTDSSRLAGDRRPTNAFWRMAVQARKLPRPFYTRATLDVARDLLGKYLVHRTPQGLVSGRIVETEAYAGTFDPASHTYYKKQRTPRTAIWYGEGGYAYVYQIYGSYVCLGIITEPEGTPGAVLVRAVEPAEGLSILMNNLGLIEAPEEPLRLCAGPSKLCRAFGIDLSCNQVDLCGEVLSLEEREEAPSIEEIVFAPRINIDYAGAGALALWRYYVRASQAVSRQRYEPLRPWRARGYPSLLWPAPATLFTHQREEEMTSMTDDVLVAQLRDLPKVELHLHLEGCMRVETLRTLCTRHRRPVPAHLMERTAHAFGTFDEFAHTYYTICDALRTEQDFRLLIADLADYLRQNTILYAEVSWTPFRYLNRGLRFERILEVMKEALQEQGIGDRVGLIIDIQRDHGVAAGTWVFEQVFAAQEDMIVGVGLTGMEQGCDPTVYGDLYRRAHKLGLGCTAHAGEYGSAQDIWQCLHTLGVSRIGHGLAAISDRTLLAHLVEHGIHLEVCPTSNVRLGRVLDLSSHPLSTLVRRQVKLSINTDDPRLFAIDLSDEYRNVLRHCGLTYPELLQTVLQSVAASFLAPARKEALAHEIRAAWEETDAHLC